jgi:hypothetical protein
MARRAARDTNAVVKERPVVTGLATALAGAPIAAVAAVAPEEWPLGWLIALAVAGGGLGGFLAVLLVLFVAKLATARRHQLEDRVADLEQTVEEHREQISRLTQRDLGDRDRFVPAYIDIRTSLRDARAKIEVAMGAGVLWDRSATFDTKPWENHKDDLGSHPWAREDGVYEPCSEACNHLRRLNTAGALRWKRDVRPGDNLEAAVESIKGADAVLSKAINKNRPSQP